MGLIKSQGFSNTVISYAGIALGYINFILLIPYAMLPEQIGLIRILQNSAAFLVPLAQLGTVSVITRFYHYKPDDETHKYSFLSYNLMLGLAGFVIISTVLVVFKPQFIDLYIEHSPEVAAYYNLIFILVFSLLFFEITESIAANNFATVFTHSLKQLFLRIVITLLAVLYIFKWISFHAFILWMVASYFTSFLILIIYMQVNKKFNLRISEFFRNTDFSVLGKEFVREMLRYGAYTILFATGSVLVNYIDTLMLGSMLGLEEVGIYSTAFYMAVVVEVPKRAISRIAKPLIAESWKNNDLTKIAGIYKKVSVNQFITGFYALLLIWLNLDYLFALMPNGAVYAAGKFVVLFIMFSKLVDMAASVNGEIISFSKHYRFNMVLVLALAVLSVVTNLIFIPVYGINGAAFASLLTILLYNIMRFEYIRRKFGMNPFSRQTVKVLLIGLLTYFVFETISIPLSPIPGILVTSIAVSVFFWLCIYFARVSEDINQTAVSIFQRILHSK